jgi:lipopolysaccharide transport system ATP-binding protein
MSDASEQAVIEVKDLGKRFNLYARPSHRLWQGLFGRWKRWHGEFQALEGVSFAVRRGETVGIVGRNGSGKSTLLQLVCGTLQPTSGTAQVRGRVAALLELGAGFNPEFSGLENVFLNAAMLGLSREQVQARLASIEAFADIGDHIHHPVKTYSSGMFVRLAFAVVAHVDADVLIVDEALAVGDAFFTQKCMRFLRQFKERGGTLLFVSHDAGTVTNLCERAIWLERGRVRASGAAKDVVNQYMAARYVGDVSEAESAADANRLTTGAATPVVGPGLIAEIQQMDPSAGFGNGEAVIESVSLTRANGSGASVLRGGESVRLSIAVRAAVTIERPVFGFYFKDRLGQLVLGDNSDRVQPPPIAAGQSAKAEFNFELPHLNAGDYVVTAALANGDQDTHRMLHWIHEALVFRSDSRVMHGLIGVPTKISITPLS